MAIRDWFTGVCTCCTVAVMAGVLLGAARSRQDGGTHASLPVGTLTAHGEIPNFRIDVTSTPWSDFQPKFTGKWLSDRAAALKDKDAEAVMLPGGPEFLDSRRSTSVELEVSRDGQHMKGSLTLTTVAEAPAWCSLPLERGGINIDRPDPRPFFRPFRPFTRGATQDVFSQRRSKLCEPHIDSVKLPFTDGIIDGRRMSFTTLQRLSGQSFQVGWTAALLYEDTLGLARSSVNGTEAKLNSVITHRPDSQKLFDVRVRATVTEGLDIPTFELRFANLTPERVMVVKQSDRQFAGKVNVRVSALATVKLPASYFQVFVAELPVDYVVESMSSDGSGDLLRHALCIGECNSRNRLISLTLVRAQDAGVGVVPSPASN